MSKEQTIKVFENLLKNSINQDSTLEFEVKYRDRFANHESLDFISGIDPSIFYQILDILNNKCDIVDTSGKSKIYKINNGTPIVSTNQTIFEKNTNEKFENFRLTVWSDRTEIIEKKRLSIPGFKSSVFPEGFKLSLSQECIIDPESKEYSDFLDYTILPHVNMLMRHKTRYSFILCLIDENKNQIPVFQFDLTKVRTWLSSEKNVSEITFELELEYLGNRYWEFMDMFKNVSLSQTEKDHLIGQLDKYSFNIAELFVDNLKFLLQKVQQSDTLIDINKHNQIFLEYLKLVGLYDGREIYTVSNSRRRDVFIGCQPETLHAAHFPQLIEQDYIIFDKSDGERMMMFICDRHIYFIDRFMHINKTSASLTINDLDNCLLDGEWVIENGKNLFLVFDALFLQKKDVRIESTLRRLQVVSQIVKALSTHANDEFRIKVAQPDVLINANFTIRLKEYVRWNKNETKNIDCLFNRPYPTDEGIIAIPNTACPKTKKWRDLLKFKPPHLNTIDLFVESINKDDPECKIYALFIHSNIIVFKRELYLLLKNDKHVRWIISENNQVIEIKNNIDNSTNNDSSELFKLHNKNVKIPFPFQETVNSEKTLKSGCVYEFYYDYTLKKLKPLHIRYDKSTRGFRGSNHLTVACDIWDSIFNFVTKDEIIKLSNGDIGDFSYNNSHSGLRCKDIPKMFSSSFDLKKVLSQFTSSTGNNNTPKSSLWRIRRYHNYIKGELIKQYCGTTRTNRLSVEDTLVSLGAKPLSEKNDSYELLNCESVINHLNAFLGITRKQLKFKNGDKSNIIVSKDVYEHLKNTWRYGSFSVVDIGFGKGGDLWKYTDKNSAVTYLVGVENESFLLTGSNDCAMERIKNVKNSNNRNEACVCLLHMDGRSNVYDTLTHKGVEMDVDVVSCFFAIHYFFRDETSLSLVLQNISEMLRHNGFFIGTLIDGKTVHDHLSVSNNNFTNKDEKDVLYSFKGKYEKENMNAYGNLVDVYLKDSIIHDYDHLQPHTKKEYLVLFDKFVEIAKHFDLELVESSMFDEFYPSYKGVKLTEEEERFSFINRAFVFRKVANSRYHRENVIAKIDSKNSYKYNHSVDINSCIQVKLSNIEKMQITTGTVQDNLDKSLLENDEILSQNIKVKVLDPEFIKNGLKKRKKEKVVSLKIKKSKRRKEGCGHMGKGCTECTRCKCKNSKVKCIEGICGCDPNKCTNK